MLTSSFSNRVRFRPAISAEVYFLLLIIVLRGLLYAALHFAGYFYGITWDTFSRTDLSWQWGLHPYFAPGNDNWLPLQFWLNGIVYRLLSPWVSTSTLLVPVLLNHLFFVGALTITYLAARRLAGPTAAAWAAVLALIFPLDVFVSYSALAEPIYGFFILLAGMCLFSAPGRLTQLPNKYLIGLACLGLLAATTHYIAWFLVLAISLLLAVNTLLATLNRQWARVAICSGSLLLCGLFPAVWLYINWRDFGGPLHFAQISSSQQAGYIGLMPISQRLTIVPSVFLTSLSAMGLAGLGAAVIICAIRKTPGAWRYLLPAAFVFAMLWTATLLALAAPYQEPRYLTVYGWVLIPYLAAVIVRAGQSKAVWIKSAVSIAVIALLAANLIAIFRFSNSFGLDVRDVADRAGVWLRAQPAGARVILETDSYAERGVIPIVAGYPYRFLQVDTADVRGHQEQPALWLNTQAQDWLAIVKDSGFASRAHSQGLYVDRIGAYFVVTSAP